MPLGQVEAKLHCRGHKTESIYGRNAIVDAGRSWKLCRRGSVPRFTKSNAGTAGRV